MSVNDNLVNEKWTGEIDWPIRVWTNPKIYDDIYLHFSGTLKTIKYYSEEIKGKVLDIGSGNSPYRSYFKNVDQYIKVDNRDYSDIDIIADITERIPLDDESIDSVVCTQVLEHIMYPEKAINEIFRVLKPGGVCLLTTHMAAPLHGEPFDYYRFTKYILLEYFKLFQTCEIKAEGGAILSIIQLMVWGVSIKLPNLLGIPLIVILNSIGKIFDYMFYDPVFTLNYSVFARK